MAIAGALIVPIDRRKETVLLSRLAALDGMQIEGVGPGGIAVVLEGGMEELKRMAAGIKEWAEVLDFDLAYLNWEDVVEH